MAAFLGASIVHLVLVDHETVEPTFSLCLTQLGIVLHAHFASAFNVDMPHPVCQVSA
jgi:hypothetical protein